MDEIDTNLFIEFNNENLTPKEIISYLTIKIKLLKRKIFQSRDASIVVKLVLQVYVYEEEIKRLVNLII